MNDPWKHRRFTVRITIVAACSLGGALFFADPVLAREISSSIALIVASIAGIATAYITNATWDDK